ncbi:hypothetical protein ACEPAI_1296 [Sanghuangporus weigelae]
MAVAPPDFDSESGDNSASAGFSPTPTLLTPTPTWTFLTEFVVVRHKAPEPNAEVHQFGGIMYVRVPTRFRRAVITRHPRPKQLSMDLYALRSAIQGWRRDYMVFLLEK